MGLTPDKQAALSLRWSDVTLLLVPLPPGKFAIFNREFTLLWIGDLTDLSANAVRQWSQEGLAKRKTKRTPTLEELGL